MTGSCGSKSFAARSTPKPSPSVSRRSDRTTAGWLASRALSASRWSRASTTVCPCASSAWRSIVRSESLSSTIRIGGSADCRVRALIPRDTRDDSASVGGSPQPAGRNPRAARFLVQVGDRLLAGRDVLLQRGKLGSRLLAIALERRALCGVVTVQEIGRERVDLRLHRIGERRVVLELSLERLQTTGPVRLVFDRSVAFR